MGAAEAELRRACPVGRWRFSSNSNSSGLPALNAGPEAAGAIGVTRLSALAAEKMGGGAEKAGASVGRHRWRWRGDHGPVVDTAQVVLGLAVTGEGLEDFLE